MNSPIWTQVTVLSMMKAQKGTTWSQKFLICCCTFHAVLLTCDIFALVKELFVRLFAIWEVAVIYMHIHSFCYCYYYFSVTVCGLLDTKMSHIPPQHQRLAVVEERLKDPNSELNIDSLLVCWFSFSTIQMLVWNLCDINQITSSQGNEKHVHNP